MSNFIETEFIAMEWVGGDVCEYVEKGRFRALLDLDRVVQVKQTEFGCEADVIEGPNGILKTLSLASSYQSIANAILRKDAGK